MRLHLFNAARLARELAAGEVGPRQQAAYMAISSIAWLIPFYFGIHASPWATNEPFAVAYHWTEFAMLALTNVFGVFYCLSQCRTDPARHFMIDFSCLYTPVAIIVITVAWATYHAFVRALPTIVSWMLREEDFRGANYLISRLHDLMLYVAVVGQVAAIYWIVGRYMRRASELRG
jgi:hypothetical protein